MTLKTTLLVGLLALLAVILAACGSDDPTATPTSAPPTATPEPAATPTPLPPGATPPPTPPTPTPRPPAPTAQPTATPDTSVADAFDGKVVKILVPFSPGGGFDLYSRTVGKYLPDYLPISRALVSNRPGAGGMSLANEMYNRIEPDGLTFGMLSGNLVTRQMVEDPGVRYDFQEYGWLGAVTSRFYTCFVSSRIGINTFEDLINAPEPVNFGTSPANRYALDLLKAGFGANINVIAGYGGGSAETLVALEQGEIDGDCNDWSVVASRRPEWLTSGEIVPLIQTTPNIHNDLLPGMRNLNDVKEMFVRPELYSVFEAVSLQDVFQYGFTAPPNLEPGILEALRAGWWSVVNDQRFIDDMASVARPVTPVRPDLVLSSVVTSLTLDEATNTLLRQYIN